MTFCDVVIEHEPCCYRLHFSSISAYVSLFFINMKLKTVDVLLVVMRARRTDNLKMTMKRSKVVQSMRRRKIMHWTSKLRVIELRKLVKEASLVWTTSALEVYLGQLLHSRCKIYVDKSALCVDWGHVSWTCDIHPNGFWSLPGLVININSSYFWLFLPGKWYSHHQTMDNKVIKLGPTCQVHLV